MRVDRAWGHRGVLAVAVLAGVCLALFAPWWLGGRVCAPLDIVAHLYEPWADTTQPVRVHNHQSTDNVEHYLLYRHTARRSWREEGRFGWNPLKSGGTPEYANTMATAFDWTFQLQRWLPFWHAWNLGMMLQYLIAMVGMLWLLRAQGYRHGLCLAGAIAYGLNTHFAGWAFHRWALGAFCWTPWFLAALDGLRRGRRIGWTAPLWLALAYFGGHLQYAALQAIVGLCFAIGWSLEPSATAPRGARRPFLSVAIVGVLGTLLAGIMFVPCAYALHTTMQFGLVRGGLGYPSGLVGALRNAMAYPLFIFPFLLGAPNTFDGPRVFDSDLMNIPYFGSLLVALAFLGLGVRRASRPAQCLVLAGLVLPLTPLLGPLYRRLLMLFILGGVWLAVDLLERMEPDRYDRWARRLRTAFLVGTVGLLLFGVAHHLFHDRLVAILERMARPQIAAHRFGARPDWFEARIAAFVAQLAPWSPRMAWPWLLLGVSIALLPWRRRAFFGPALAAVLLLQLWRPHREWLTFRPMPDGNPEQVFPASREAEMAAREIGPDGRVLIAQKPGRLPLFPPNTITYYEIDIITAYDSILPNGLQRGIPTNPMMDRVPPAEMLAARGVTHLIAFADSPPPDGPWERTLTVGEIAVFSNRLARARHVATTPAGEVAVTPHLRQRNRRRIALPAGTTLLTIRENWDEGWRYRVDGGPWARAQRADDGSLRMAVTVGSAPSVVEMDFAPRVRWAGYGVTGVGILAYAAVLAVWRRHKRKPM